MKSPDFASFLKEWAFELNTMRNDIVPSVCARINSEFREKSNLSYALQYCGAGERTFNVIKNDCVVWEQKGLFSDLEGKLIAANIGGGNILVDGLPLLGLFRWHSDGTATLVALPQAGADAEPSRELSTVGLEQQAGPGSSSAAPGPEIERGKFTERQIGQLLGWIDAATLSEATLHQIGMALHYDFDGGNAGLRLWDALCQRIPDYNRADREQQYRVFNTAAQARSTISIVHDLAISGIMKYFNSQIAWRKDSNNSAVYQVIEKQVITVSLRKLIDEYGNRLLPQWTSGGIKLANPISIWMSHPDRRDAYGTCAKNCPDAFIARPQGGFLLNIFRGLAEPGEAGGCERFKQFLLEVICSNRREVFQWVWNWMAWIVQNPTEPPRSAIMLNGRQGTGKNLFYSYLAKAIGEENCYLTHTSDELFGPHNHLFQGKRLCCADEAYFESDPRQRNDMKGKITCDSITVNPKNVSQFVVQNMAAWLLLSNSEKSPENTADGRRITYITPAEKYIPMHGKEASDAYYSPIFEERDGKGPASLLRELLDTDLGDFKPYPKLATPEGQIAAKHGDLGDAEWFRDFVETGEFPILVARRSDGLCMVHQTYAKEFVVSFQRSRGKRFNEQSAGMLLQKLGFEKGGKGHKFRIIPPLVEVRKAWIEKVTPTPEFLDNASWEDENWDFQQGRRAG